MKYHYDNSHPVAVIYQVLANLGGRFPFKALDRVIELFMETLVMPHATGTFIIYILGCRWRGLALFFFVSSVFRVLCVDLCSELI